MKCTKCGADIHDGAVFCPSCGTPVSSGNSKVNIDRTVLVEQPQDFPEPEPNVAPSLQFNTQPHQQNQFIGQPQGMYGQGQFNQQPKQPRKPLSKKTKTGIATGFIVAVLAIIFFVIILPILTRSKLKGEYVYKDIYATEAGMSIVFDDGTYVVYYIYGEELDIIESGTYTFKNNEIVIMDLDGKKTKGTFDSKKNTIKINYVKFESSDENATTDIELTDDYLDLLEDRTITAAENAVANKSVAEELEYTSYIYIYDDKLANPDTEFDKAFAREIGYNSDETLKNFIENGYIVIYLEFDSNFNASATFSVY